MSEKLQELKDQLIAIRRERRAEIKRIEASHEALEQEVLQQGQRWLNAHADEYAHLLPTVGDVYAESKTIYGGSIWDTTGSRERRINLYVVTQSRLRVDWRYMAEGVSVQAITTYKMLKSSGEVGKREPRWTGGFKRIAHETELEAEEGGSVTPARVVELKALATKVFEESKA